MYTEAVNNIRCLLKDLPENQPVPVEIIASAANILLEAGKLRQTPVPIIRLCKNMGFEVYRQNLPEYVCGYIAIDGDMKERLGTDRIISVNQMETASRRRFTVAHELGHYLFDFDPARSITYYEAHEMDCGVDEEALPAEAVCNRFAAELLMPKDAFTKAYEKASIRFVGPDANYNIVQQLSEDFLVPPKAVKRRLVEELNLMSE